MATVTHPIATPAPAGSPAWKEQRRLGVGGSDAAAMFSEGYGCRTRLIFDKAGVPENFARTEREEAVLERGTELEDAVADKFVKETGLKVRRQQSRVAKDYEFARVNIDRQIIGVELDQLVALTIDRESKASYYADYFPAGAQPGPGVLECKTINEYSYKKLLKEGLGLHPDYIFQVQHSLAVTGYTWGIFAFLEPTWWQFLWFPVKRDEPLIAAILEETRKVQAEVLAARTALDAGTTPAELVAKLELKRVPDGDKRCKSCLWRRDCRGQQYLDENAGFDKDDAGEYVQIAVPEVLAVATDYKEARAIKLVAEEEEKRLRGELEQLVKANGNPSFVEFPGVGLKLVWNEVAGAKRLDTKAVDGEVNRLESKPLEDVAAKTWDLLKYLREQGFEQLAGFVEKAAREDISTMAERLRGCRKISAPTRPWKPYVI